MRFPLNTASILNQALASNPPDLVRRTFEGGYLDTLFNRPPEPHLARISDSLLAVAGDMAGLLAMISPFPHQTFLGLPRTIQHLVGLVLSDRSGAHCNHARRVMEAIRFGHAMETAFGRRLEGVEGVLKRSPPTLFSVETYRQLRNLIEDRRAMKVLQHAELVTHDLIAALHTLPPEFRRLGILKHILTPADAEVVALAVDNDQSGDGVISRSMLAKRLTSCGSRKQFFEVVEEELFSRFLMPVNGPVIDDPRITAIRNVKALIRAGRRYRNCLRKYCPELTGELAFYEFDDGEHQAVISVKAHFAAAGVLDELNGVDNKDLPDEGREKVVKAFAAAGVISLEHAGTRLWNEVGYAFNRLQSSSSQTASKKFSDEVVSMVTNQIAQQCVCTQS